MQVRALPGTTALKPFNWGLAGSDERCTSPRSGQGEVAAGRRQQGSPGFRGKSITYSVISWKWPATKDKLSTSSSYFPLCSSASSLFKSHWCKGQLIIPGIQIGSFYGQDQTKANPQQCGLALAACLSRQPRAGKMRLILPTAHFLGRSCQTTDGEEWRRRRMRMAQSWGKGSSKRSVVKVWLMKGGTEVVHARLWSPAAALLSQNHFSWCWYCLNSNSWVTLGHGRIFWAMHTQVGSSFPTTDLPH